MRRFRRRLLSVLVPLTIVAVLGAAALLFVDQQTARTRLAEAQLGPSDYKMTGARGGVHAKSRFGSDQITVMAQSSDVYDAVIQIVSAGS